MSSETGRFIEVFVLSPWIAFVIAVAWSWLLDIRGNVRAMRASEQARLRHEKRLSRKSNTTA